MLRRILEDSHSMPLQYVVCAHAAHVCNRLGICDGENFVDLGPLDILQSGRHVAANRRPCRASHFPLKA